MNTALDFERPFEDVYIAVMGITGSGKSSFISSCTGKDAIIGHSLRSETQEIKCFEFFLDSRGSRYRVILIDTPGFDDSNRSDAEILRQLADWFAAQYRNSIHLSGFIYLHSIAWTRMTRSAKRSIEYFMKLCGDSAFRSIVVVTTFWDVVEPREGQLREAELQSTPEFFGNLMDQGSRMVRSVSGRHNKLAIVEHILAKRERVVLAIQHEIVDLKCDLMDTAVGKMLYGELEELKGAKEEELRTIQVEMQNAIVEHDVELIGHLAKIQNRIEKQIAKVEANKQSLGLQKHDLIGVGDYLGRVRSNSGKKPEPEEEIPSVRAQVAQFEIEKTHAERTDGNSKNQTRI